LKREEPKVLTLGPSEPRRWPIKPRRRASTPVRTKIRRRYSTEAPRWGKATDDFAPLAHFPRHHKVSTTPPPTVEEVLYHVEQHRVEAEAKPLTAAEEVLYHVERHRLAFLNLFTNWGHGKPLELGPPTFPANIFDTDPKLAMFWAKRLDTNKYPELDVNWQWRRGGVREALHDQARKSRWISKERRRQINRAHYFNGLMVLTPRLTKPPKTRFPYPREAKLPGELRWRRIWVAPPVVCLQTWRAPVDVVSYSGKMIKRAGERINLGTEATEDASRVIARQRAKRRQLETAYTVAGYVSAATGRRNITLSRVLESVSAHYENDDRFRAALNAELPGAVILAASDGLAPDLEYGTEEMKGDVVEDRYRRSTKAYNERLRKLGYLDWDDEASWGEFPEEKPLPEPLETEVQRLTQDAKSWVLYANRHCRTDFADVVRIRDGDERRKLVPDTRSDGTDPANGYQDTRGWQLW